MGEAHPSPVHPGGSRAERRIERRAHPPPDDVDGEGLGGRADRRPRRRSRLDPADRRGHRRQLGGGAARARHGRIGGRSRRRSGSSRSCSRPATSARPSSTRPASATPTCWSSGLPYKKRFGGDFAIGRTVPYVLKNAPCAVWVVREPIPGGVSVKIVIVGCGRVGAVLAGDFDAAGHDVIILDLSTEAFDRLPSGFRGICRPRRRDRRGHPAAGGRGGRGRLHRDDRGRQPQRHGGPARPRGARRPAGDREDQRPGPGRGLRRSRDRDAVPDEPDVGRDQHLPRAAGADPAGRPRPDRQPPGRRAPRDRAGGRWCRGRRRGHAAPAARR